MSTNNNYESLMEYKERFKIALKIARICVFEVDLTKQLYTFFENAEDIFGVSGETILNDVRPYSELNAVEYQQAVSQYFSHPEDLEVIDRAFKSILSGKVTTYQARMKAGETQFKWCKIDVTPIMKDNIPIKMIGVITDITEIKAKNKILEDKAKTDLFTGLFNKAYTQELISKELSKETNEKHGLILFDLDQFKIINDTYGHAVGDKVLKSVAKNLKRIFRKTDILGRFGGDEFIILIKDIPSREFLISRLQELVRNTDNSYGVTKSIGVAIFPDEAMEFEELFKKADQALYTAKNGGKNQFVIGG